MWQGIKWTLSALVLGALLTATSPADDQQKPGETKQVVINAAGGQVGSGLELPPGFPKDFIVPSDWNIMAANAPMPQNYMVQAIAEDDLSAVLETVREEMSELGWLEAEPAQLTPQMSRISFEKDDRLTAYTITQNGETQLVQVVSMPKP